ncbi:hypothetical protein RHGRI_013459 [Rhododendron griersonianum]|uniref:Secreted protein n=1 Tax=Rhododendron griersonianum TaxID=479676 RepID=A0AAV6K5Z3_9ERIC|nr:hypothetical protein RHGRI_013459 [Rhododendron griersonianum]
MKLLRSLCLFVHDSIVPSFFFNFFVFCPAYFNTQKTKRATKVEVGTKTTDASMDEWLQVCFFFSELGNCIYSVIVQQIEKEEVADLHEAL